MMVTPLALYFVGAPIVMIAVIAFGYHRARSKWTKVKFQREAFCEWLVAGVLAGLLWPYTLPAAAVAATFAAVVWLVILASTCISKWAIPEDTTND